MEKNSIIVLEKDPRHAANSLQDSDLADQHKQCESILATAHRVIDGTPIEWLDGRVEWKLGDARNESLPPATRIYSQWTQWVREAVENYNWLVDYYCSISAEAAWRFQLTAELECIFDLLTPPLQLKDWDRTPMPFGAKTLTNYRQYYKLLENKVYTRREPPEWLKDDEEK